MIATQPLRLDTLIAHSHLWTLYVRIGKTDEAYALCDCGAELTHEQIEGVLNSRQYESQYEIVGV